MSDEPYNPAITWFRLSDSVRRMLVPLYDNRDSAVFQQIWKAELTGIVKAGNTLTLDQIEQSIWQPTNNIWQAFCRGMVSRV